MLPQFPSMLATLLVIIAGVTILVMLEITDKVRRDRSPDAGLFFLFFSSLF